MTQTETAAPGEFRSWDDVTGLWPSDADCARAIGIKPSHLGVLKTRGNIPSDYWPPLIEAAAAAGFAGVTAETLLALQARMKADRDA